MKRHLSLALAALLGFAGAIVCAAPAQAQAPAYHEIHSFKLGGNGGWDYLTYDSIGHRLFIARSDRVEVVDPTNGKVLGEIPGFKRAHGVALDYAAGKGFATSGGDSTVVIFDLHTLKVLGRTIAAPDCDAIAYDPVTHRVFTFNGDASSSSVIDAATGRRLANIPLGAHPEFGVSGDDGNVYVNLVSSSEVAEINARTMKVTRRWSIKPCTSPSGLAVDPVHHRLFSGCHSKVMGISDTQAGRLITTLPIGAGVDATRFDAGTQDAFASTGDGNITVIHEASPGHYTVVQTIHTMLGARTMGLDPVSHRLFTVSAHFGPPQPRRPGERFRRRSIVPGSFTLLVYGR